jgi:hypothetical protein
VNWAGWLLWGFVATVMLTTVLALGESAGYTRLDLVYLLGAMVTPKRDRARAIGFGLQLAAGWVFSFIYISAFGAWGGATWWRGAVIGAAHAAFLLAAGLRVLPGLHPRMAAEDQGPAVARQLEPPDPFGTNYGSRTPLAVVAAHLVCGIILGASYASR